MLKVEYEILIYIREHDGCSWTDVLNRFDPQSSCRLTDGILHCLVDAHLVDVSSGKPPICSVRLSDRAWHEMASYQQSEDEKKDQQRQRRTDRLVTAAISIFSAVIGGVIGLLHQFF